MHNARCGGCGERIYVGTTGQKFDLRRPDFELHECSTHEAMEPEETTMHCCQMECEKDAEFEIHGESGRLEDNTHACTDHVGALLGTPEWLIQEGHEENRSWTVVWIGDDGE